MAKPDDEPESLVEWGTLEELLLTCAINRHGTNSWDSVAKEVQKRTSASSHSFTSLNCKHKYHDLRRRFASHSQSDLVAGAEEAEDDTVPLLDELRRRRIAELKRDLERFDLSIGSLQLKLKRLSEEREQCSTENGRKASDLQRSEGDGRNEEEGEKPPLPDRENRSVNASNSSEPRGEESAPAEASAYSPVKPAACEDSNNGSSDTIAVAKAEPVCDSAEFVESVAESKRGEEEEGLETVKSQARSSASRSGKKGRSQPVSVNKSGAQSQRAADNCVGVKPQPLADLLDEIRLHKFGSVFERRLRSQESSKYKNMIRQHVDLATIRKRLEEGAYSECHSKFYRDLLLLATNATLFYPESAPEHNSAIELRWLVSTKLASKPKLKIPFIDSPLALISPVIACRKRSSVVLKPPSGETKREGNDEKPLWLSTVTKKRTRDLSSSVSRTEENTEVQHKSHDDNTIADTSGSEEKMKKKSVRTFLNRIRGTSTDSIKSGSGGGGSGSNAKREEKGKGKGKSSSTKRSLPVNAKEKEKQKEGSIAESCKRSSPVAKEKGKQKEASNGEDSKRNNRRPPTRAAAVAGIGKRRGDDKAEGALPKKRSRK